MRREVADILANSMRDPRISSWVSVIDVEITGDMSFARVFVRILDSEHADQAMQVLQRAAGFVRRELAPRLGLREVPEIRFLLDRSIESGARVEDLLRKISQGEPLPQDDEDDEKQ
jgi:ribosome-binding factor A